jgi:hypothetical protein
MQVKYEDEFKDGVVYLDGDETNDEEGNVINELNFTAWSVSLITSSLSWEWMPYAIEILALKLNWLQQKRNLLN